MNKLIFTRVFLFFTFLGFLSFELDAQCHISLEINELYCVSDSTYNMVVSIDTSNLTGNVLEVKINDVIIDQYSVNNFPLTITGLVQSGALNDHISICVLNDPTCCAVFEYAPPTNYCADCFNYWLDYSFTCDTDSTYEFVLTPVVSFPDQMAREGNLLVEIDAQFYEFEYEIGNSYTISGVELSPNTVFHEILFFFVEVDCGVSVIFIASPDCQDICSVEAIEVNDLVCTSDSTYQILVDAQFGVNEELKPFLSCWVSINGENQGFFSLDAFPIIIDDVAISNADVSNLSICVPDIQDCCRAIDYNEPDCNTTSVRDITSNPEVFIYPNPVADIMQLENRTGELFIYTPSGNLVMHEQLYDNQVNVELLPSGVYYFVLHGEYVRHGKFIKQ